MGICCTHTRNSPHKIVILYDFQLLKEVNKLNNVIYPDNFEHKIEFNKVRQLISDRCLSTLGREKVEEMHFLIRLMRSVRCSVKQKVCTY